MSENWWKFVGNIIKLITTYALRYTKMIYRFWRINLLNFLVTSPSQYAIPMNMRDDAHKKESFLWQRQIKVVYLFFSVLW